MDFDYKNLIIDNIFTESEIEDIYKHVDLASDDRKRFLDYYSQTAYFNWLPQHIVDTLVAKAQATIDTPIVLRELSFARYEKKSDDIPVRLTPHRDETFREPRLTVDIQVKSNIDWPISVEGREYQLKDNQALTFAGTHQVHWRPKRDFKDGEFLDMVFCHFSARDYVENELGELISSEDPSLQKLSEHDKLMHERAAYWRKIYDES